KVPDWPSFVAPARLNPAKMPRIPCFFPVEQGNHARDEFAPDCLLSQLVFLSERSERRKTAAPAKAGGQFSPLSSAPRSSGPLQGRPAGAYRRQRAATTTANRENNSEAFQ